MGMGFSNLDGNQLMLLNSFLNRFKRVETSNFTSSSSSRVVFGILPNSKLLCIKNIGDYEGVGYLKIFVVGYENKNWREIEYGIACFPTVNLVFGIYIGLNVFWLANGRVAPLPDCLLCFNIEEKCFNVFN